MGFKLNNIQFLTLNIFLLIFLELYTNNLLL